jgi:tetratricopeptide (TPR) repeat protein
LQVRLNEAAQRYDTAAAETVADEARALFEENHDEEALAVLVHALLLVADLQRMEFEFQPEDARSVRRAIGNEIDEAAQEGLRLLDTLPPTSETWRMRADFYGTMIRSDYRATRYRKAMDEAIAQALQLDAENPFAHVSAARPLLFADATHGQDLDAAAAHLDKALALAPDLEVAQVLKAVALEKADHADAALTLWRQLLQRNPHCLPAQRRLETLAGN